MKATKPDWSGRTVVCIASGPSLTPDDCEAVRASGLPAVVTNTTFRLCPWADVLFAFDAKWWNAKTEGGKETFYQEAKRTFSGRLVSGSHCVAGVETTVGASWFNGHGNSGTCALAYAIGSGATKVILLGYDSQKTDGKTHWHGDHPPHLSNARSIASWPALFNGVAAEARVRGVNVVNASRQTALTCFVRVDLKSALS